MIRTSLPPNAPMLLDSMRAIGYDAATAIADLIDNSITAAATSIDIRFPGGRPTYLTVLDNGCGMDEGELATAMTFGSRSPQDTRESHDLGRFGLGLKTASISQCRRLTVVTKRGDRVLGMEWNLDDVGPEWNVGVLEPADIAALPHVEHLERLPSGTLVIWRNLDRLAGDDTGDGRIFGQRMSQVREHLALVFHRYLSRSPHPVTIKINNTAITPLDPFLEHLGSQRGQVERIAIDDTFITLQAFTLPHISKLSPEQIAAAGGEPGLRKLQGFYVYRNARLIIWGTWFRLTRHAELTKLTRVRVDVPNSLDHFWHLDIKKSAAKPPEIVRERLKALIPNLVQPSTLTSSFRAKQPTTTGVSPLWLRLETRDGFVYKVDPDHPLIAATRQDLPSSSISDFDAVISAIGDSLPYAALYHDMAQDSNPVSPYEDEDAIKAQLEDLARLLLDAKGSDRPARDAMLARLPMLEPFTKYTALTADLIQRLSNS